ncbi:MAG: Rieske 2Fe-2S domain-containing protein [Gammaproteobacteria bacterium]
MSEADTTAAWVMALTHADLASIGDPGAREFFVGDLDPSLPGALDAQFRGFIVQVDGLIRAYVNICPHKRHALNAVDDEFLVPGQRLLRCASHGALFEPESGLCVYGPCAGRSLRALPCRVESDGVRVQLPGARPDRQLS